MHRELLQHAVFVVLLLYVSEVYVSHDLPFFAVCYLVRLLSSLLLNAGCPAATKENKKERWALGDAGEEPR